MNPERIALITGANKGIGLQVSREPGMLGHTVPIGARSRARGTALETKLTEEAPRVQMLEHGLDTLTRHPFGYGRAIYRK